MVEQAVSSCGKEVREEEVVVDFRRISMKVFQV